MCTVVLLNRPDHPWPLMLAGNHDERFDADARIVRRADLAASRGDVMAGQD